MKLVNEFVKYNKEMAYDIYCSLVYETKAYDKITRNKMYEEIIAQYAQDKYLYC